MKKSIVVLSLVLPSLSFGSSLRDALDTIEKVRTVRDAVKNTATMNACAMPETRQCSFESYCSQLTQKAQSLYLYQNAEGRQIPNFQMILNLRFVESCLRSPFEDRISDSPFLNPELFGNEQAAGGADKLKKNKEIYKKESERANSILKDVKRRAVVLVEKRRTSKNSKEIDVMIRKIMDVELNDEAVGDFSKGSLASVGCADPNAYYDPATRKIILCPQLMNVPDASLVAVLSHELGHSLDPCMLNYWYVKGLDGELEMSKIDDEWQNSGDKEIEIPFIPPEKSPFKEVVACLESPSSMNIKVPAQAELIRRIDKKVESLQQESDASSALDATTARLEDGREVIKKHYDRVKYCSSSTGNGQVQEAFSDWLSAQIIADKVKEAPDSATAKQFAFESQSVFLGVGCENIQQAVTAKMQKASGEECSTMAEELQRAKELDMKFNNKVAYQSDRDRVDKIYLSKPEIQSALGCKPRKIFKECK